MNMLVKLCMVIILILCGGFTMVFDSIFKGLILIIFCIVGLFVVEQRQVNRTIDYLEPLLFRCGRVAYVASALVLLKKSLLFQQQLKNKLAYIEIGYFNVIGDFEKALIYSESYKKLSGADKVLVERERTYAQLKLGQNCQQEFHFEGLRGQLIKSLQMIACGQSHYAIHALEDLRGQEAGNVIFKEVNELLANLLVDELPEEAAYYQLIAESFELEKESE